MTSKQILGSGYRKILANRPHTIIMLWCKKYLLKILVIIKIGSNISKRAKEDFEERTGQKVVTDENYLPVNQKSKIGKK